MPRRPTHCAVSPGSRRVSSRPVLPRAGCCGPVDLLPVTAGELATALGDPPATEGVRLLVLHGSRARNDHRADSDWDFGVLADDQVDTVALWAELTAILGTDLVDLADLRRSGALLRYRAARDGVCPCWNVLRASSCASSSRRCSSGVMPGQ
ncbi:nucleotidyltransferase domain-containing protein [Pseudonocardia sp.]|uniref:nucleotidyltransferase domain-containing protein n=1 Tax=Pseudonocardia sp. TaxID=60912 RepID=UPI0039C9C0E1